MHALPAQRWRDYVSLIKKTSLATGSPNLNCRSWAPSPGERGLWARLLCGAVPSLEVGGACAMLQGRGSRPSPSALGLPLVVRVWEHLEYSLDLPHCQQPTGNLCHYAENSESKGIKKKFPFLPILPPLCRHIHVLRLGSFFFHRLLSSSSTSQILLRL